MTWIDGTGYVVSPLDGVNGILIAVVDGRKGFPEAIASVYPQTVVHLHRAPDPQQPGIRGMAGPQGDPACDQGDLSRRERRNGHDPPSLLRFRDGFLHRSTSRLHATARIGPAHFTQRRCTIP